MEMKMQTLEELHAHYMAVRARLNGGKPKLVLVSPVEEKPAGPYPEPVVEPFVFTEPEPVAVAHEPLPQTPAQIIMSEVSEAHNMTIKQMKGQSREMAYVKARQEVAYRLNTELGYSLTQIGRLLGKRDHTTILHSINRYKKNLAQGGGPWARKSGVSSACVTQVEPQAQDDHV